MCFAAEEKEKFNVDSSCEAEKTGTPTRAHNLVGSDNSSETLDQVVLVHSNKVCLVSLAPNHPIICRKLKISRIEEKKSDYLTKKAVGKSKKNCAQVDEQVRTWTIEVYELFSSNSI